MNRRPSRQTVAVLTALAADPATWRYGYELGRGPDGPGWSGPAATP